MNTVELETTVAGPIQSVGMAYYFDPDTAAAAGTHGVNVFEFYGLGRGGVLGNVSSDQVAEAFWFFHKNAINNLWSSDKAEPEKVAQAHIDAAYAYADKTFGSVSPAVLTAFAAAARKIIDAVPADTYALFDGYRKFAVPSNPVHAAYLSTILLRELRGGVHIASTRKLGISANEACFISDEFIFKIHGYSVDDAPTRTPDLEARMAEAEAATTATMASYLEVLTDDEMKAFAEGVEALSPPAQA